MLSFVCGFVVGVIITFLFLSVFGLVVAANDYDRAIDDAFDKFD